MKKLLSGLLVLFLGIGSAAAQTTPWSTYIFSAPDIGTVTDGTKIGAATAAATGKSLTPLELQTYLLAKTNSWSAANTFTNTITLTGLGPGTQVSCLGLDASNKVVLSTPGCGTGSSGGTVTSVADATNGGIHVASPTSTPILSLDVNDLTSKSIPVTGDSVAIYDVAGAASKKALISAIQVAGSGGGTTNFLRADGTWASPPGGGTGTVTNVASGTGLTGGPITTTGTLSFANIGDAGILANITGGSAVPSSNTLTAIIDHDLTAANVQGSVLYRNATSWVALGPGTSGQALESGGAGANPSWVTLSGTGTVTSINTNNGLTGGVITTTGTIGLAATANQTLLGNGAGSTAPPVALTLGNGFIATATGLNLTVPEATGSTSCTIAAGNTGCTGLTNGDMGANYNFTSTPTITIPAISSTIFPAGTTFGYNNIGTGNGTISTAPTINGIPSTTLRPGAFGNLISNGSSLDCFGCWPGHGTITQNALTKYLDASPSYATGSSAVVDSGTTLSYAPGVVTLGANSGTTGSIKLFGGTSGDDTISVPAIAGTATKFQLPPSNGSNGQFLQTDGSGVLVWASPAGGGTVNAGTAGQLTYYATSAAAVSGNPNATISSGNLTLGVANTTIGEVILEGNTSGAVTIKPQAAAGTPTVTWGTSTGTPAVTASSPLVITAATGDIACATCVTSAASLGNNVALAGAGSQGIQALTNANFGGTAGSMLTLGNASNAGSLVLDNGSGGNNTISYAGSGNHTTALPANDGTVAETNFAQTFTATQTFATIGGYKANVHVNSGTSCTVAVDNTGCSGFTTGDCGTFVSFSSASAVTVTIPNSLPVGCQIAMEQDGAGQITPTAGAGATFHWPYTKSRTQYSTIGFTTITNSGGSSAVVVGSGDGV